MVLHMTIGENLHENKIKEEKLVNEYLFGFVKNASQITEIIRSINKFPLKIKEKKNINTHY